MSYTAYCDGGSRGNPGPAASGIVIKKDNEVIFTEGIYLGKETNNVAEWTSLIMALEAAKKKNYYPIHIYMDSMLVVNQVQDLWKVKTPHLMQYYKKAKTLVTNQVKFEHIRREYNKEADAVVNICLDEQVGK
jgi:ribonuclease HI